MIREGERIPAATLTVMGAQGPESRSTQQLFAGKKVVLFAVPGAFTPTCSQAHLPGYVARADSIKARGVDRIICVAVNDVFVMDAWGKSGNAAAILMAADGNAEFTGALGLELDASGFGMGLRSRRYAMIVEDGIVTKLHVEAPGELKVSDAESILPLL